MSTNSNIMPHPLTAVIKKSITGNGLIGYLKEYPSAVSQGDNEKDLCENLLDALFALMDAKARYNNMSKPFDGDSFEKEIELSASCA